MNRRGFLQMFGAGVAGIALEQAIPLGRVWSFPKNIVVGRHYDLLVEDDLYQTYTMGQDAMVALKENFMLSKFATAIPLPQSDGKRIQLYSYRMVASEPVRIS